MQVNRKEFESLTDFAKKGRGCATTRPNNYQIERNDERLRGLRVDTERIRKITINVQFIHITDNGQGHVTEQMRVDQVEVLNKAYKSAKIKFTYSPDTVKTVENPDWFFMDHGSVEERQAKTELHTTPERNLNFYTGGLAASLLGWATFPWELAGDRVRDGVVVQWQTLPGGDLTPYHLGMTAVHEVGHWLGLFHTFQGGCDAFGDHIQDTISHREPNVGKLPDNERNGACMENERAPVHNFMNYSDDEWLSEFTKGQIGRIAKHVALYRPRFIQS